MRLPPAGSIPRGGWPMPAVSPSPVPLFFPFSRIPTFPRHPLKPKPAPETLFRHRFVFLLLPTKKMPEALHMIPLLLTRAADAET